MELHNMDPDVLDELYKIASINLSPNTPGQVISPGHLVNLDSTYKKQLLTHLLF